MAPKLHKVKVTIVEMVKGPCSQGFKVGDSWIIDSGLTPPKMCAPAFANIYPWIRAFRYNAEIPYGGDPNAARVPCPDGGKIVIYEVKKLPEDA